MKNKILAGICDTFQKLTLIITYVLLYEFTSGFLKVNASKGPASMFYEIYAPTAKYWNIGFLLVITPFFLLWINRWGFNWEGIIKVHAQFPIILMFIYMLSAIIYWIAYDVSSYHY
ncbi:hypothetical protein DLB09_22400 [Salmonella enterica subsp. salamae]|nr:hypothetical protein [Salmonella enterica subsp. salamae]